MTAELDRLERLVAAANDAITRLEAVVTKGRQTYQDLKTKQQEVNNLFKAIDKAGVDFSRQHVAELQGVMEEAIKPIKEEIRSGVLKLVVDDTVKNMLHRAFSIEVARHDESVGLKVRMNRAVFPELPGDWQG